MYTQCSGERDGFETRENGQDEMFGFKTRDNGGDTMFQENVMFRLSIPTEIHLSDVFVLRCTLLDDDEDGQRNRRRCNSSSLDYQEVS